MRRILLVLLVASCDPSATTYSVTDDCGPVPLRPGHSAYLDSGRVTLSRADWDGLRAWDDLMSAWAECAAGRE